MIFIYRALRSGMVSWKDVKSGNVTCAELLRICDFLDMKADIEKAAMDNLDKKRRR